MPLVEAGDRIRWMGGQWTVDRILYSKSFKVFFSCTDVDGNLEFIDADGSGGGYELLPPAAARDSDRLGQAAMPLKGLAGPAVTPTPSPAAAVDSVAAAAAVSEELLSHGGPGEPGTGGDVSLRETAGSSSEAISRPVDDWRFRPRPWRP